MSNPKHPPRKSEEPEYAACLLMVGPPNVIAMERWNQADGAPTSSLEFKAKCSNWYKGNLCGTNPDHAFHVIDMTGRFDTWYARYKTWLLETRDGN